MTICGKKQPVNQHVVGLRAKGRRSRGAHVGSRVAEHISEAAMVVVVLPLCVAAEIQSCHLDIEFSCSIDADWT